MKSQEDPLKEKEREAYLKRVRQRVKKPAPIEPYDPSSEEDMKMLREILNLK